MFMTEFEEVPLGKKIFHVSYEEMIDPDNFQEKCPGCGGEEAAHKLLITITEVSVGEERTAVELSPQMLGKLERALRRKMVSEGALVTEKLGCNVCRPS